MKKVYSIIITVLLSMSVCFGNGTLLGNLLETSVVMDVPETEVIPEFKIIDTYDKPNLANGLGEIAKEFKNYSPSRTYSRFNPLKDLTFAYCFMSDRTKNTKICVFSDQAVMNIIATITAELSNIYPKKGTWPDIYDDDKAITFRSNIDEEKEIKDGRKYVNEIFEKTTARLITGKKLDMLSNFFLVLDFDKPKLKKGSQAWARFNMVNVFYDKVVRKFVKKYKEDCKLIFVHNNKYMENELSHEMLHAELHNQNSKIWKKLFDHFKKFGEEKIMEKIDKLGNVLSLRKLYDGDKNDLRLTAIQEMIPYVLSKNALETYRDILKHEPDNEFIRKMLYFTRENYLELATLLGEEVKPIINVNWPFYFRDSK